jgi:hypothetical protein
MTYLLVFEMKFEEISANKVSVYVNMTVETKQNAHILVALIGL